MYFELYTYLSQNFHYSWHSNSWRMLYFGQQMTLVILWVCCFCIFFVLSFCCFVFFLFFFFSLSFSLFVCCFCLFVVFVCLLLLSVCYHISISSLVTKWLSNHKTVTFLDRMTWFLCVCLLLLSVCCFCLFVDFVC